MWTHRATVIGGQTAPGDRQVLRDGVPVGRVYFGSNYIPPMQWRWFCGSQHGSAETMADALECVRRAAE
jgi:hypothetical protein